MALSRDQSLQLYGTESYTGWGEAEASADAQAKGISADSSSSSSSFDYSVPTFDPNSIPVSQPTLTPLNINIEDYINAIRDTLPAPPEEYLKANPFYFDEQAARDVSTAEFSPYYDELLSDYLGEIKLTSEKNRGDVNRILADLDKQKEVFMRDNAQNFEKMIRGIKEGYSGKGLYFSGNNVRDQKETEAQNTNVLEGYLNTYGSKTGQARAEDEYSQTQLSTQAQQRARDLTRDKTASIYGGVNTQKNEAIDEYLYGMQTYYKNPNWKSLQVGGDVGDTTQQQGTQY
jgi:hypothetical protein